jgi:hypothetical protein
MLFPPVAALIRTPRSVEERPTFCAFVGGDWGSNSGLHTCKAGTRLLPGLYLTLVILEMGSHKLFIQAGLEP